MGRMRNRAGAARGLYVGGGRGGRPGGGRGESVGVFGGEGVDGGFEMGDGDCEERGGKGMVLRGNGDLRFRIAEFILGLVIMGVTSQQTVIQAESDEATRKLDKWRRVCLPNSSAVR